MYVLLLVLVSSKITRTTVTNEYWSAILRTLKDAVKVGGYFFATFFDASKIEKLVGDVAVVDELFSRSIEIR